MVVSALPKVTDLLLQGAREASERNGEYDDRLQEIKAEHEKLARCLLPDGPARRRLLGSVGSLLDELRTFYTAVYSLEELTPRTLDAVAAIGERLSCELVAAALGQPACAAQAVDARTVLITDDGFCAATAAACTETEPRARIHLKPMLDTGVVPVLGGFMGATLQGVTTTLGRGGSDWYGRHPRRGARRRGDPDLDRADGHDDRRPADRRRRPRHPAGSAPTRRRSSPTSAPRCCTPRRSSRRSSGASRCAS